MMYIYIIYHAVHIYILYIICIYRRKTGTWPRLSSSSIPRLSLMCDAGLEQQQEEPPEGHQELRDVDPNGAVPKGVAHGGPDGRALEEEERWLAGVHSAAGIEHGAEEAWGDDVRDAAHLKNRLSRPSLQRLCKEVRSPQYPV